MTLAFFQRTDSGDLEPSFMNAINFPAGEAHIAVSMEALVHDHVALLRGADSNEILQLAMWADAAHASGSKPVLLLPYLPGARQDRGIPFGAKVYADLINSMDFAQVVCVDPHSSVMPDLLNNLTVINSDTLIREHVDTTGLVGLICPDQGAHARTERASQALGLPVFYAKKKRNQATGKLSGFECEELPAEGRFLVPDDICDGGGTFAGLADATGLPKERLDLWVTHGVFSGKASQINDRYGRVYTTDSHPGALTGKVDADVVPLMDVLVAAIQGSRV
jgi:ribose-phosphate pyrophosphokinase